MSGLKELFGDISPSISNSFEQEWKGFEEEWLGNSGSDNVFKNDEDWTKNDDFVFGDDGEPEVVVIEREEDWTKKEDFLFKRDDNEDDEKRDDVEDDEEYLSFDTKSVSKEFLRRFQFQMRILQFEKKFERVLAIREVLLKALRKHAMKVRIASFNLEFRKTFLRRCQVIEKYAGYLDNRSKRQSKNIKQLSKAVDYWSRGFLETRR